MRTFRAAVKCGLALAAIAGAGYTQTKIDLRTQGRDVDFSTAGSTKPSKTGTTLPVLCSVGETFLNTSTPAGKNFYFCSAANVWTMQGIEMPDPASKTDQVLTTDGSAFA